MKSKIKYLILIILLLFISSGLITFAMFRLYKNASGNVSAARWNVSFKNGSETLTNNFNINLANSTWTNPFGTVATGKIAPGSETTFNLTIDATGTETDVEYKVELGSTNVTDFVISTNNTDGTISYSTTSGAMVKQIPITVKWLGSMNDDASKKARDNSQTGSVFNLPIVVTAAQKTQFYLGKLVYYDPVSTNTCNSQTFNLTNINNGTSTCYKWRVIDTDTSVNDLNIQLDHNLVNTVAWNSSNNNNEGPVTILTQLASSTASWTRVSGLTYEYNTSSSSPNNYGKLSCNNGTCTITKTGTQITNVKARLITGEEVSNITKTQTDGTTNADTWSISNQSVYSFSRTFRKIGTFTDGYGNINLSWLIENTYNDSSSGASANSYGQVNRGYWTLTNNNSNSTFAYSANSWGNFFYSSEWGGYSIGDDNGYGARPVIKVSKSDLN